MNQAIIAFDDPVEMIAGDFGPEELIKKSVVKVAANVNTSELTSITSYADIYILPQAAEVNLADLTGTTVTKVKSTDVTDETDHPFGVGVGYVKIRYIMS